MFKITKILSINLLVLLLYYPGFLVAKDKNKQCFVANIKQQKLKLFIELDPVKERQFSQIILKKGSKEYKDTMYCFLGNGTFSCSKDDDGGTMEIHKNKALIDLSFGNPEKEEVFRASSQKKWISLEKQKCKK